MGQCEERSLRPHRLHRFFTASVADDGERDPRGPFGWHRGMVSVLPVLGKPLQRPFSGTVRASE